MAISAVHHRRDAEVMRVKIHEQSVAVIGLDTIKVAHRKGAIDLAHLLPPVMMNASRRYDLNLNQITIAVSDLKRAIAFYEKLGLTLIVNSPESRYARFECGDGGATFSLHESEDFSPTGAAIYFEVVDVDAKVRGLKDSGLAFEAEPVDQRWLWREAWLRDPDGYRIGIYHAGENRRFPPWRVKA